MIEKKGGSDARKRPDPKRKSELKRLLHSKGKELKTQEAKIFMKFAETYPKADLTLAAAETIWAFIVFLKKSGYHIIDQETVFCFPFSHLVRLKDLK